MHYKSILVAFDGSDQSINAVELAGDMLSHNLADEVTILAIVDPVDGLAASAEMGGWGAGAFSTEAIEKSLAELRAKAQKKSADFCSEAKILLKVGKPQKLVTDVAKAEKCDLIIMGSRGLGSIRGSLGSVSHAVLRDAEVPVFIIK